MVSRTTAVHALGAATALQQEFPGEPIEYLTLGEGRDVPFTDAERQAARAALGFTADTVAFGVFGGLTLEKRVPEMIRAFRACLGVQPSSRLLLAGNVHPSLDWRSLARDAGVEGAVILRRGLDDVAFDQALVAVDVSLNLRWPSAHETSGPWLRALAEGRATVVTDLAHQSHVPSLDPRTWQSMDDEPVTIAIDILDEAHSLGLALRRLATDAALRDRLGRSGRRYWECTHTFARMRDEYLAVIDRAAGRTRSVAPPACSGVRSVVAGPHAHRGLRQPVMRIVLNGDPAELPGPMSIQALLERLQIDPRVVAVECDRVVIKRARHAETMVTEGTEVEIVAFIGGGAGTA